MREIAQDCEAARLTVRLESVAATRVDRPGFVQKGMETLHKRKDNPAPGRVIAVFDGGGLLQETALFSDLTAAPAAHSLDA